MYKNNKGFSAVVVLLSLLLVTVIGFTGYYVYNTQQEKNNKTTEEKTSQELVESTPQQADEVTVQSNNSTVATPNTTVQYVNGVAIILPNNFGTILTYARTPEASNLSSTAILEKERATYGDTTLSCEASDYALGRVTVKNESEPFPGEALVKKLESGQYLFYADDSRSSMCYKERDSLRSLIDEQVTQLKQALRETK